MKETLRMMKTSIVAARSETRSGSGLRRFALAVGTVAVAVVGMIAPSAPALAAAPTTVATEAPTRLVQSTGNLYWTNNFINEFGPSFAGVYRTGKSDTPGSERLLYSESRSDGYFYFGDLAYANVGGSFFGYFAANYVDLGFTQIKRIPLAGGTAVVLATLSTQIGARDLVTDGSFLYWADAAGLRRMSLGGGTVTTLAGGTNLLRVGLDANQVYYSAGTTINSVPKSGGAITQQVVASSAVKSLYVQPAAAAGTVIYWAEENASVKSRPVGGAISTYQGVLTGRHAESASFDGTRVLWSDCSNSGNNCFVRKFQGGSVSVVSTGSVGAGDVQGDASAMFWGTVSGVNKYIH